MRHIPATLIASTTAAILLATTASIAPAQSAPARSAPTPSGSTPSGSAPSGSAPSGSAQPARARPTEAESARVSTAAWRHAHRHPADLSQYVEVPDLRTAIGAYWNAPIVRTLRDRELRASFLNAFGIDESALPPEAHELLEFDLEAIEARVLEEIPWPLAYRPLELIDALGTVSMSSRIVPPIVVESPALGDGRGDGGEHGGEHGIGNSAAATSALPLGDALGSARVDLRMLVIVELDSPALVEELWTHVQSWAQSEFEHESAPLHLERLRVPDSARAGESELEFVRFPLDRDDVEEPLVLPADSVGWFGRHGNCFLFGMGRDDFAPEGYVARVGGRDAAAAPVAVHARAAAAARHLSEPKGTTIMQGWQVASPLEFAVEFVYAVLASGAVAKEDVSLARRLEEHARRYVPHLPLIGSPPGAGVYRITLEDWSGGSEEPTEAGGTPGASSRERSAFVLERVLEHPARGIDLGGVRAGDGRGEAERRTGQITGVAPPLAWIGHQPVSARALDVVPRDAPFAWVSTIDGAALATTLREVGRQFAALIESMEEEDAFADGDRGDTEFRDTEFGDTQRDDATSAADPDWDADWEPDWDEAWDVPIPSGGFDGSLAGIELALESALAPILHMARARLAASTATMEPHEARAAAVALWDTFVDDIVPRLGPDVAFHAQKLSGTGFPGLVLEFAVRRSERDPRALDAVIRDFLGAMTTLAPDSLLVRDRPYRRNFYVEITPRIEALASSQIGPHEFVIALQKGEPNDRLLIGMPLGSAAVYVRRLLRGGAAEEGDAEGRSGVAGTAAPSGARHPLLVETSRWSDVYSVGFVDVPAIIDSLYGTVRLLGSIASGFGGGGMGGALPRGLSIDFTALPTAEALVRHLVPHVSVRRAVDGYRIERSTSNVGPEGSFALPAIALGFIGWSSPRTARSKDQDWTEGGAWSDEWTIDEDGNWQPVTTAPAAGGADDASARRDTERALERVRSAIQVWSIFSDGALPATLEDLVRPTRDLPRGAFDGADVPRDGWGRGLEYRRVGEGFRLWSRGSDGIDDDGAGDDIEL